MMHPLFSNREILELLYFLSGGGGGGGGRGNKLLNSTSSLKYKIKIIYELPLFQICVLFTGYTVEQVDSLEAYTDKDGGHVQKLYRDLQTRYNFTLCQLVDALQNIERLDILDELSHIEEFKHLEWSKRMTPESSFENQILQPSIDNQIKTALPQNIRLIKRDENKSDCNYQKAECKSDVSNREVSNKKLCTSNDESNSESSVKRIVTALGVIAVSSFIFHRCVFR